MKNVFFPLFKRLLQSQACMLVFLLTLGNNSSKALPPPEDLPEEILRTEIILEGRSPIDGVALTPAEYETLQAQLQESRIGSKILIPILQELIFLLQVRKFIKTFHRHHRKSLVCER